MFASVHGTCYRILDDYNFVVICLFYELMLRLHEFLLSFRNSILIIQEFECWKDTFFVENKNTKFVIIEKCQIYIQNSSNNFKYFNGLSFKISIFGKHFAKFSLKVFLKKLKQRQVKLRDVLSLFLIFK